MAYDQYLYDPTYGLQAYLDSLGQGQTFAGIDPENGIRIMQGDDGGYLSGEALGELMGGYDPKRAYEQAMAEQGQIVFGDGTDALQMGASDAGIGIEDYINKYQGAGDLSTDQYGNLVYAPDSGQIAPFPEIDMNDTMWNNPAIYAMLAGAGMVFGPALAAGAGELLGGAGELVSTAPSLAEFAAIDGAATLGGTIPMAATEGALIGGGGSTVGVMGGGAAGTGTGVLGTGLTLGEIASGAGTLSSIGGALGDGSSDAVEDIFNAAGTGGTTGGYDGNIDIDQGEGTYTGDGFGDVGTDETQDGLDTDETTGVDGGTGDVTKGGVDHEDGTKTTTGGTTTTPGMWQRFADGTFTADDIARVFGTAASTWLGYDGAQKQADTAREMQDKYLNLGAPYRTLLEQSYKPGFSMANEPGYTDALDRTTDAYTRMASAGRMPGVSAGNPIGNPGAWAETMKNVNSSLALPALQNYRSGLSAAGQLGVAPSAAYGQQAGQASSGAYNAVGYGLGQLTAPQDPYASALQDLFKNYKTSYI